CVAPAQGDLARRIAVLAEPGERVGEDRLWRAAAHGPVEVARPVGELAIDRIAPGPRAAEELEAERAPVERVDAGEGLEAAPPDACAPRGRRLEAEAEALIRRHLRGQLSRDRIHDVEGLAEDARVFLDPSDARHRHGGRGETLPDLRLRGQVVLGEDTQLG